MCCGQTKTTHHPGRPPSLHPDHAGARRAVRRPAGQPPERFEYTGPTRLTVRGPGSGRTYLFDGPGARLAVDPRDAPALLGVPGLRPVGDR